MIPPLRFCAALLPLVLALPLAAQITEAPQTIQPGRLLVEIDGVRLTFGRVDAAGNKVDAVGVASTLVSTGLTSSLDLQVGVDLFLRERYEYRGARDSRSGLGDVRVRAKWNFWRDEKRGAAAIIPYVTFPSSTGGVGSDAIAGGFVLPWEQSLGGGVTFGAMFQWDIVRNDAADGYDTEWTTSAVIQRDLTSTIGVYAEAQAVASSTGFSNWAGLIGGGATWKITKRLQLDYQLLRGLNARAGDWTHVWRANWEW